MHFRVPASGLCLTRAENSSVSYLVNFFWKLLESAIASLLTTSLNLPRGASVSIEIDGLAWLVVNEIKLSKLKQVLSFLWRKSQACCHLGKDLFTINLGPFSGRSVRESSLTLSYKTDWPVNVILTEESMASYRSVFSFLIQIFRFFYWLCCVIHCLEGPSCAWD